jgi:hypothetical protein
MLAEVVNARFAIGQHDAVAVTNDVAEALSFANQLPDHPSRIIRSEPMGGGRQRISGPEDAASQHQPLTDFAALVGLTSAQAELPGNLAVADGQLRAIENRIRAGPVPGDLPLLRAAASLDLARIDATEGRTADLKTQLVTAQLALNSWVAPDHSAEAKALAATIAQTVGQTKALNTMLPYQPGAWLSQVVHWAGTDRWNAPLH